MSMLLFLDLVRIILRISYPMPYSFIEPIKIYNLLHEIASNIHKPIK